MANTLIQSNQIVAALTSKSVNGVTLATGGTSTLYLSQDGTYTTPAGGGSPAFTSITSGTNTTAAMVVGSGATLAATGTGTITATTAPLSGITGLGTGVATFLATPSSANLITAVTDETGSGSLVFNTAPTFATSITTPSVLATSNGSGSIGASGTAFSNLFLASAGVINFAAGNAAITHSTGIITVSAGDLRVTNAGSNSASVVLIGATQTITSKWIQPRTGTTASSGTPTINTDTVDFYSITALAAAITSFTTNLSGTPVDGQTLWIAITDNGTARAITWGAKFEASGTVALPTTTVISTRLDVRFVWNTVTSKWRCVGVA